MKSRTAKERYLNKLCLRIQNCQRFEPTREPTKWKPKWTLEPHKDRYARTLPEIEPVWEMIIWSRLVALGRLWLTLEPSWIQRGSQNAPGGPQKESRTNWKVGGGAKSSEKAPKRSKK